MTLHLSLAPSPRSPDVFVAVDETLLSELPAKLGAPAPLWSRLADSAFDDPELTMRKVEMFAAEVALLRERWVVIAERNITARDHAVRMQLADAMLAERADPTRATLDQLAELCEAALTAGVGVVGASD